MSELYVGMMSGTSLDGIDAALVELDDTECRVIDALTHQYPADVLSSLNALVREPATSLLELGRLDVAVAEASADAAQALLDRNRDLYGRIVALGLHGHTIYHEPEPPRAFTMQLGDPNTVAARTGLTVVADLRGMDVALGGQGAPMVPPFHAWRFSHEAETRVIVNLGGIANVTCLEPDRPVRGYDTGPANTLMDLWCQRHRGEPFDREGAWAASGTVDSKLLQALLEDDYFRKAPPKSTGRERFNIAWLERALGDRGSAISPEGVQATLLELTAATICQAIAADVPTAKRVILCGGGAYNRALVQRLEATLEPRVVETSAAFGIAPEWIEAVAFAWLAKLRLKLRAGNIPTVTGAREPVVLGGVYSGERPSA